MNQEMHIQVPEERRGSGRGEHVNGVYLGPLQAEIYKILLNDDNWKHIPPNGNDIAKMLGKKHRQTIHRSMQLLKKKGLVDNEGRPT